MDKGLSTPTGKGRNHCQGSGCHDELCSVCLSPVKSSDLTSTSNKGEPVVTKCKHSFHAMCLSMARRWKSECPLCRSALSPILQRIQWAQSSLAPSREEIAQAANRARNAVRLAMMRRSAVASAV